MPKVEEEGVNKRSKVVRKALGQPKAIAPYSYSLNSGHAAGAMVAQYEPEPVANAGNQARASAASEAAEGALTTGKPNAQNKHQIEVKLSKVDPYRSAFPVSNIPENMAMSSSFQHQGALAKKQAMAGGGMVHAQELTLSSGPQYSQMQY